MSGKAAGLKMWCVCVYALSPDPHHQPCGGWSPARATLHGMEAADRIYWCVPHLTSGSVHGQCGKKPPTLIDPLLLGKTAQCSPGGDGNSPSVTGLLCSPCLEVLAPSWWAPAALQGAWSPGWLPWWPLCLCDLHPRRRPGIRIS